MCEFQPWISSHLIEIKSNFILWIKKNISQMVVTNFVTIEFVEQFKKIF